MACRPVLTEADDEQQAQAKAAAEAETAGAQLQTAIFFIAFCRPSRGPRAYEPKSTALSLSTWPTIGRHALDVTP